MKYLKEIFTLTIGLIALLLSPYTSYAQQNRSFYISSKSPEQLYLGAVLEINRINSPEHPVLPIIQDSLVIIYNLGTLAPQKCHSSKEAFYETLKEAFKNVHPDSWANQSFSFNLKDLNSYKDVELFYGQNLELRSLFTINDLDAKPNTLIALNMERVACRIDMDFPNSGEFKYDDELIANYDKSNLIYINNLFFGRKAFAIIESNLDSKLVSAALNAVLKEEKLRDFDQEVLSQCTFRVHMLGHQPEEFDNKNPIQNMITFIQAAFTAENLGYPIGFEAAHLKTSGLFENTY